MEIVWNLCVMFSWNNVSINIYGAAPAAGQRLGASSYMFIKTEISPHLTAWQTDDVLHAFLKALFSDRRSWLVQISGSAQNRAHGSDLTPRRSDRKRGSNPWQIRVRIRLVPPPAALIGHGTHLWQFSPTSLWCCGRFASFLLGEEEEDLWDRQFFWIM